MTEPQEGLRRHRLRSRLGPSCALHQLRPTASFCASRGMGLLLLLFRPLLGILVVKGAPWSIWNWDDAADNGGRSEGGRERDQREHQGQPHGGLPQVQSEEDQMGGSPGQPSHMDPQPPLQPEPLPQHGGALWGGHRRAARNR